jgi:hypothetical protein
VTAQSFSIGVKEICLHFPSVPSAENVLAMQQNSSKSLKKKYFGIDDVTAFRSVCVCVCVYLDYCNSQADKHKQKM